MKNRIIIAILVLSAMILAFVAQTFADSPLLKRDSCPQGDQCEFSYCDDWDSGGDCGTCDGASCED